MAKARARVRGMAELETRLRSLPEQADAAAVDALGTWGDAVAGKTRRDVPVDTGNLRDDVDSRVDAAKLIAEAGWFDPDDYYATFVERGTKSMPARPSLLPAFERQRRKFPRMLRKAIKRRLR